MDVHGHVQLVPGRSPGCALSERLAEHAARELARQARALGELHEGRRREQALLRVAPADEGLGPRYPAVGRTRLGLQEDLDLAALQGAGQLGGQRQTRPRVGIALARVDGIAAPGRAFASYIATSARWRSSSAVRPCSR